MVAQPPASWLTVNPASGIGSAPIEVHVDPTGLTPGGVYHGNFIIESSASTPQFESIPVTLQLPYSGVAAVNGASFQYGVAPGMIVSLFDPESRLAGGIGAAKSVPLPQNLEGASVTVNGVAAPLYYVSPGQVNAQIPYETPPGTATLIA